MVTKQDWIEAKAAIEAIEKERADLVAHTNERLSAAEERFDEIEEQLSDSGELIDQCEGCSQPIFEGEKHFRCNDGIYLCEECAPTYENLLNDRDFWVNEEGDQMSLERAQELYNAHIAAGGKPTDSMAEV
jgi:hypothetical protein